MTRVSPAALPGGTVTLRVVPSKRSTTKVEPAVRPAGTTTAHWARSCWAMEIPVASQLRPRRGLQPAVSHALFFWRAHLRALTFMFRNFQIIPVFTKTIRCFAVFVGPSHRCLRRVAVNFGDVSIHLRTSPARSSRHGRSSRWPLVASSRVLSSSPISDRGHSPYAVRCPLGPWE